MKCGLCEGNHLTIACPRLGKSEQKQASSVGKQALAQPKALPTDSDRKHIPANTLNTAANSEPVNTNKDESVNTAANKDEPVNCLQCAALRQRIAELEARLAPKPRMGRAAYMRDYMRQYRARKVPG